MSLSRTPSPSLGGGWSTPGLDRSAYNGIHDQNPTGMNGKISSHPVTWASARARGNEVRGFSQPQGGNFIKKQMRRLSMRLPRWAGQEGGHYAEKEKLGRGRWQTDLRNGWRRGGVQGLLTAMGRLVWRQRLRFGILAFILLVIIGLWNSPLLYYYRRTSFLGGGSKFVLILAANLEGGVMEWKGPREWAIERDSVRNKKKYVRRWGYELEIVDMTTKKKYAHEWRESWEKVDTIRNAMRKYPNAEWFWWLDLNTFIMEPSYSLQSHIFNHLEKNTYRDINVYNPLGIWHPLNQTYLDEETRSPIGDGKAESINMIVPQDCGGFNLGSFFMRRSQWSDRLLDIWWDPVLYEQKHMQWEHKEQDALEHMYTFQPWVRPHVAFIPQRSINSFPPGACGDEGGNPHIHYNAKDRDFMVNMAGCEWGRDCWGEMYSYRQLSNRLNRNPWEKFKDFISESFNSLKGSKDKAS